MSPEFSELSEKNVLLAPSEEKRIQDALTALAADPHAPREISVRLILHIHNEYPKAVTVGEDKDGNPIVKTVQNEAEEEALQPAAPQESSAQQIQG